LIGIVVVGLYPALVLSSFNPAVVLKGKDVYVGIRAGAGLKTEIQFTRWLKTGDTIARPPIGLGESSARVKFAIIYLCQTQHSTIKTRLKTEIRPPIRGQ